MFKIHPVGFWFTWQNTWLAKYVSNNLRKLFRIVNLDYWWATCRSELRSFSAQVINSSYSEMVIIQYYWWGKMQSIYCVLIHGVSPSETLSRCFSSRYLADKKRNLWHFLQHSSKGQQWPSAAFTIYVVVRMIQTWKNLTLLHIFSHSYQNPTTNSSLTVGIKLGDVLTYITHPTRQGKPAPPH